MWIGSIPKEFYTTSLLGHNILLQSEYAHVSAINTLLTEIHLYYLNELIPLDVQTWNWHAMCMYIILTSTITTVVCILQYSKH